MKPLEIIIGIASNLVSGTLLYFFLPAIVESPNRGLIVLGIISITTLVTLLIIVSRWIYQLKKFGIKNIVLSMTQGKGSPPMILKQVNTHFAFMGIAARKWIDTGSLLTDMIQKVGSFVSANNTPLCFLLLDPDSSEAKRLSMSQHNDENKIPNSIRDSITYLQEKYEKGFPIELHLYSFLPKFRIVIVDNDEAFVGFYRLASEVHHSPQLILSQKRGISYFQAFREYFDQVWEHNSKKYVFQDKYGHPG
jgi:hypothetical protein